MRLLLLRHGQTTAAPGRYVGAGEDPPLSAAGRDQARAAGAALARRQARRPFPRGTIAVVSPLRRARETAELALPPGVPVRVDPRLRELHLGALGGLCWEEVEESFPEVAQRWRAELWPRAPGGEEPEALVARVLSALLDLAAAAESPAPAAADEVIAVCHAGPIRMAVGIARGLAPARCWPVRVQHGALRSVRVTPAVRARWASALAALPPAGVAG